MKVRSASILILYCIGCRTSQIVSKPLPNNPTIYNYKIAIPDATSLYRLFRNAYNKYHNDLKLYISDIFYNDDGYYYTNRDSKNKYLVDKNRDDICMTITVDSSEIYYRKNGKRLEYTMQCRLHQIPNSDSSVGLEVQVLDSKVHIRDRLLPTPPHFVNDPVYKKVMPTTIEEYKILLCIGKFLNYSGKMPSIIVPN